MTVKVSQSELISKINEAIDANSELRGECQVSALYHVLEPGFPNWSIPSYSGAASCRAGIAAIEEALGKIYEVDWN